jgi:hypothetical protein
VPALIVAPACVDVAATFETTWYVHPSAPDFPICSYCYTQHIAASPFSETFRGALSSDGKPRSCRFSKPRMKDHLFKTAVASGHIQPVINWMRLRSSIPDCRGVTPLQGDVGYKWFRPREANDIPGFVLCQACYEDHVLTNSLSAFFEPTQLQGANEWWACDMAVPYILFEYNEKGKSKSIDAWKGFASEAKGRMTITPCPGRRFTKSHGKRWFIPSEGVGPRDLLLCHACYCDHVAIHKDFAPSWSEDTELARRFTNEVRCSVGSRFNVRMSLAQCEKTEDFAPFWRAMSLIGDGVEKVCDEKGILDGTWYTFPSHPPGFRVCRACFVSVGPALSITQFFVPLHDHEAEGPQLCCLNVAHPRFKSFLPRLVEMYFTRSRTRFETYVATHAGVPPCPRENEVAGRKWFGWRDCTICAECHHDFASRHPSMVEKMELKDTLLPAANMCEMYSPRMRELYASCAASSSGTDPGPLRAFAARRRLIYVETVPRMRQMIQEQRMMASQQGMMGDAQTTLGVVRELERRWKDVE